MWRGSAKKTAIPPAKKSEGKFWMSSGGTPERIRGTNTLFCVSSGGTPEMNRGPITFKTNNIVPAVRKSKSQRFRTRLINSFVFFRSNFSSKVEWTPRVFFEILAESGLLYFQDQAGENLFVFSRSLSAKSL